MKGLQVQIMFCCSFAGVMLYLFLAAVGGLVVLWLMSTPLSQQIIEFSLKILNSQFASDAVCDGIPFSLNAHFCFWIYLFESRNSKCLNALVAEQIFWIVTEHTCGFNHAYVISLPLHVPLTLCQPTHFGMHVWNAVIIITSGRFLLWRATVSVVQMISFCAR